VLREPLGPSRRIKGQEKWGVPIRQEDRSLDFGERGNTNTSIDETLPF
jgi:hypothetical protein